ncbi:TolC family protein [Chryseolinea sp. T2]|uniref:TolC family protein n=1 Tax=Chryseolinea sp. T2 TaxID=3129255 RepID=UPI003077C925
MARLRGTCIILLFFTLSAFAQTDTLRVNLHDADSLFAVRSFYLLAAGMNVEANRALIVQASLFPNPIASADINAYDPQNETAFHVGSTGQKSFQLEQLILLGGKRKNEIELARTNARIAELELLNTSRTLKFKLHTELAEIGQQQVLLQKYNSQLALLDTILRAYEMPVKRGSIALKDLVRLKGVYLNLNNDRAELMQKYFEAQATVQTLLQANELIYFQFSDNDINTYIKSIPLEQLKDEALQSHPELLLMQENQRGAEVFLRYQKSLSVPDLNLNASYDQRGGAFLNQINTGLSIPLPLWNRNQGNIKASAYRAREAQYNLQATRQEKLAALQNHYALYTQTVAEYQKATALYNDDFDLTVRGMVFNFQRRNVSLLEFVDFFESYNQVLAEIARMKTQLVTSAELLNLSIGKDVF